MTPIVILLHNKIHMKMSNNRGKEIKPEKLHKAFYEPLFGCVKCSTMKSLHIDGYQLVHFQEFPAILYTVYFYFKIGQCFSMECKVFLF